MGTLRLFVVFFAYMAFAFPLHAAVGCACGTGAIASLCSCENGGERNCCHSAPNDSRCCSESDPDCSCDCATPHPVTPVPFVVEHVSFSPGLTEPSFKVEPVSGDRQFATPASQLDSVDHNERQAMLCVWLD